MATRQHLVVGQATELLCTVRSVAEAYLVEAKRHGGGLWLLEVTPAETACDEVHGFDLGLPSGGFSVVESELIIQELAGPRLNQWGLIDDRDEAFAYLAERTRDSALEDTEGIEVLAVKVLREPEHGL